MLALVVPIGGLVAEHGAKAPAEAPTLRRLEELMGQVAALVGGQAAKWGRK